MHGPELTYSTLAQSRNVAATELLVFAATNPNPIVRGNALGAILKRSEPECPVAILECWDAIHPDCYQQLRRRQAWLCPAIEASLASQDKNLLHAIRATETIGLHSQIQALIPIAESHTNESIRTAASDALLQLAHELGHDARAKRDKPALRAPAIASLAECVTRASKHRNEKLIDAFLTLSTWGDPELRSFISAESQFWKLLARRMLTTQRVGIVELVAGFISRRNVPRFILDIIAKRTDDVFRDSLLRAIGSEPSTAVLKNLTELGMPQCCAGEEMLMGAISQDHRAAAVYIYNQTCSDRLAYLRTVVAALMRGGPGCVPAAISGLLRCEVPEASLWLKAATVICSGDPNQIASDPNAVLLQNLINMLDRNDPALVRAVRHVLGPLHADSMIEQLPNLSLGHQRAIGKIVMTIDFEAIDRIRDGLRHPVLTKRLAAIAAADALAAVDLLGDAFERIAREDHQQARVLACQVMSRASSETTLKLLNEMASLPPCPVSDAAVKAISFRKATITL